MVVLFFLSSVSLEGFVGNSIGAGIRYMPDSSHIFRLGLSVGFLGSDILLPFNWDVLLNAYVNERLSIYTGLGTLAAIDLDEAEGMNPGVGMRITLAPEYRITDNISLSMEISPTIVKILNERPVFALTFRVHGTYHIIRREPQKDTVKDTVVIVQIIKPETTDTVKKEEQKPEKKKKVRRRYRRTEEAETTPKEEETQTAPKIDKAAADREYKLGLQAYANGDLKKAKLHFEAALRYDPTHSKAKLALDKVKRQLGEK